MIDMGFLIKRRRPLMPAYLLRQPADHSRTTYSVPKKSTSTISCRLQSKHKAGVAVIQCRNTSHTNWEDAPADKGDLKKKRKKKSMTHIEYSATHSGHQNQRPGLTVGYKRVMIGVTGLRSSPNRSGGEMEVDNAADDRWYCDRSLANLLNSLEERPSSIDILKSPNKWHIYWKFIQIFLLRTYIRVSLRSN